MRASSRKEIGNRSREIWPKLQWVMVCWMEGSSNCFVTIHRKAAKRRDAIRSPRKSCCFDYGKSTGGKQEVRKWDKSRYSDKTDEGLDLEKPLLGFGGWMWWWQKKAVRPTTRGTACWEQNGECHRTQWRERGRLAHRCGLLRISLCTHALLCSYMTVTTATPNLSGKYPLVTIVNLMWQAVLLFSKM